MILLPISLLLALLFCLARERNRLDADSRNQPAAIAFPVAVDRPPHSGPRPSITPGRRTSCRRSFIEETQLRAASTTRRQIFRNRANNRTWFVQCSKKPGENEFNSVQVLQQDEQDNITRDYLATHCDLSP